MLYDIFEYIKLERTRNIILFFCYFLQGGEGIFKYINKIIFFINFKFYNVNNILQLLQQSTYIVFSNNFFATYVFLDNNVNGIINSCDYSLPYA